MTPHAPNVGCLGFIVIAAVFLFWGGVVAMAVHFCR